MVARKKPVWIRVNGLIYGVHTENSISYQTQQRNSNSVNAAMQVIGCISMLEYCSSPGIIADLTRNPSISYYPGVEKVSDHGTIGPRKYFGSQKETDHT